MFKVILLLVFFSVTTACFSEQISCEDHECLAIVDAGSTGSRLHIYSYDLDLSHTPKNIIEIYKSTITPGIASIGTSQDEVYSYLKRLFSNVNVTNMPVIVFATGGMRLISKAKQQIYFNRIQNWFALQTGWRLEALKTLTGKEEGVFGWLSVNYDLGTLSSTDKPYVGVLDTGGASVQISFPIKDTTNVDYKDIAKFSIYGRDIKLFVHSFLGLGRAIVDAQFMDTASCFSSGYVLPNNSVAQGDFATCRDEISPLFTVIHRVNKVVKPAIDNNPINKWYVIGELSYLVREEPLQFEGNEFTIENLAKQANEQLCHQDWVALSTKYPSNENLWTRCLDLTYYNSLLLYGYGFSSSQKIHYMTKSKSTHDWSLGVVLYH